MVGLPPVLCANIDSKHGTGLKDGNRMASYVIKGKYCRFIRLKCNLLIAKNVPPSGPLGNSTYGREINLEIKMFALKNVGMKMCPF